MNFSLSADKKKLVCYRLIRQIETTIIQSLLSVGIDPDKYEPSPVNDLRENSNNQMEKIINQTNVLCSALGIAKSRVANS
jgi:hypothetical protein